MAFYDNWSILTRLLVCLGGFAVIGAALFLDGFLHYGVRGFLLGVFLANVAFMYWAILPPIHAVRKQYRRFNHGYDHRSLFNLPFYFTPEQKEALHKVGQLLDSHEVNRVSNRQAQYLALQNQINPHFLYNTLEAIRGDALSEGMESVANVTEALATFFRYTISNMDNLVPLEEELSNAENYFAIQNYRFGDRISMLVKIEDGSEVCLDYLIPKLTLQPIIENAIIHGLEDQVGPGKVSIHISSDGQRLLINITDDGIGMEREALDGINRRLGEFMSAHQGEERMRGGIALINVHNRIRILFGEQYGLMVSSIKGVGTQVEVNLPVKRTAVH